MINENPNNGYYSTSYTEIEEEYKKCTDNELDCL